MNSNEEHNEKLKCVQKKYLPFLKRSIQKLQQNERTHQKLIKKMERIYDLLEDKTMTLKPDVLRKAEVVMEEVYQKLEHVVNTVTKTELENKEGNEVSEKMNMYTDKEKLNYVDGENNISLEKTVSAIINEKIQGRDPEWNQFALNAFQSISYLQKLPDAYQIPNMVFPIEQTKDLFTRRKEEKPLYQRRQISSSPSLNVPIESTGNISISLNDPRLMNRQFHHETECDGLKQSISEEQPVNPDISEVSISETCTEKQPENFPEIQHTKNIPDIADDLSMTKALSPLRLRKENEFWKIISDDMNKRENPLSELEDDFKKTEHGVNVEQGKLFVNSEYDDGVVTSTNSSVTPTSYKSKTYLTLVNELKNLREDLTEKMFISEEVLTSTGRPRRISVDERYFGISNEKNQPLNSEKPNASKCTTSTEFRKARKPSCLSSVGKVIKPKMISMPATINKTPAPVGKKNLKVDEVAIHPRWCTFASPIKSLDDLPAEDLLSRPTSPVMLALINATVNPKVPFTPGEFHSPDFNEPTDPVYNE